MNKETKDKVDLFDLIFWAIEHKLSLEQLLDAFSARAVEAGLTPDEIWERRALMAAMWHQAGGPR